MAKDEETAVEEAPVSYSRPGDKLIKARCRLMSREPWYGTFAMAMEWKASEMNDSPCKTMGVRIMDGGRIECVYYPPFVDSMTIEQLYGVVMHEIEHIVRLHCLRRDTMQHPLAWNIAADMCVNGKKSAPRIGYKDGSNIILPLKADKEEGGCVWIPNDWPENETTEEYYKRLEKSAKKLLKKLKSTCPHCGKKLPKKGNKGEGEGEGEKGKEKGEGQGQGQGQGEQEQEGQGGGQCQEQGNKCPHCGGDLSGESTEYGDMIDDHSTWNQSNTAADEARQVVKNVCDQATAKNRGQYPGHMQGAIEALNKPIVSWQQLLRNLLGSYCGKRRLTYSRRNRRFDRFGMKGTSHHAAARVSIVVDTSGSVSDQKLKQFFTEIEAVTTNATVSMLQWDHGFQGYTPNYQRGDWKKIKIGGRGGTDMNAPVEWYEKNKGIGNAMIMLTDGECNWPSKREFPMIFAVMNNQESSKPDWGNYVFIKTDI